MYSPYNPPPTNTHTRLAEGRRRRTWLQARRRQSGYATSTLAAEPTAREACRTCGQTNPTTCEACGQSATTDSPLCAPCARALDHIADEQAAAAKVNGKTRADLVAAYLTAAQRT